MDTQGRLIQHYRTLKGLNQLELAEKIGMSQTAISQFEKDQRRPTPVVLKKIAETLDISENQLSDNDYEEFNKEALFRNVNQLSPEAIEKLKDLSEYFLKLK